MTMAYRLALVTTFVTTLLAATGCANARLERIRSRLLNTEAKNFTLASIGGSDVSLSDFRGKPVLLTFFAVG